MLYDRKHKYFTNELNAQQDEGQICYFKSRGRNI